MHVPVRLWRIVSRGQHSTSVLWRDEAQLAGEWESIGMWVYHRPRVKEKRTRVKRESFKKTRKMGWPKKKKVIPKIFLETPFTSDQWVWYNMWRWDERRWFARRMSQRVVESTSSWDNTQAGWEVGSDIQKALLFDNWIFRTDWWLHKKRGQSIVGNRSKDCTKSERVFLWEIDHGSRADDFSEFQHTPIA